MHPEDSKRIIVVGNGMVGQKLVDQLTQTDTDKRYDITVLGEEPRPAYDRVHLTSFFAPEAPDLTIADSAWYAERRVTLHLKEKAVALDTHAKIVTTEQGRHFSYDVLVLATGSHPFVPKVSGVEKKGVFTYRTIEDLEAIRAYAEACRTAAVIGGGLLGLEAAKACVDLGLDTAVLEHGDRLMPRQLDARGAGMLRRYIESLGIAVFTHAETTSFLGNGRVTALSLRGAGAIPADMVVVSAGIRPNDALARQAALEVAERGGIVVDERLRTSAPDVYAIGECASYDGMVYGLVAPGFTMAKVLAANLCGADERFVGADMSTKLKLLGVEVASLGDPFEDETTRAVEIHDTNKGIYKKLVLDAAGEKLKGAILVGSSEEYGPLSIYVKNDRTLPESPEGLIMQGNMTAALGPDSLADDDTICTCNAVSKGAICRSIGEEKLTSVAEVQRCTKAGTGCGGCAQMVQAIFKRELEKSGIAVDASICEHFKYSRRELFDIVRVKKTNSFEELLESHGRGDGCEVCKTTIASILASLWNAPIVEQSEIQDTNDRYLANIQRNGTYSVIPRTPGGELTPKQLMTIGSVAEKYHLYTKITGSQRVAMFGAHVGDLPDIWEALGKEGLKSGHAYTKGLRMVKSCVGSTWCHFGVDTSVDFAIELENRYKGLRSPHKLKAAVSGCSRECAEAMSKDFGLIATEKGWNLFVCGNGGTYPRHADLLAGDIDKETAVKYLDRFLMYYVHTADKGERTATWLSNLDGGIEKVRNVVIRDSLGINADLEAHMQHLLDTQFDEWAEVVSNTEKRARFTHFANDGAKDNVRLISVREQIRPVMWEKAYDVVTPADDLLNAPRQFIRLGTVSQVPRNSGATFKYGRHQIAVFNFAHRGEWYASQNLCPHKREMVLARGLIGDKSGIPKVACPLHKKSFSLKDGRCLTDSALGISTFRVALRGDEVFVELPSEAVMDALAMRDPNKECRDVADVPVASAARTDAATMRQEA